LNDIRYVYFAEGPKQALGYGLGSASQYLRLALLLPALLNVYVKLSIGLGSVISPLVCQSIIATGVPWYRFYYGSLLLSFFNVVFLYITFKPTFGERDREHQKALNESRHWQNLQRSGCSSPTSEYPAAFESKTTLYLDAKPRNSEFQVISPLKIKIASFAYSAAPCSCDAISVGSLLFRPSLQRQVRFCPVILANSNSYIFQRNIDSGFCKSYPSPWSYS
jgi:hypothetical protein